MALEKAQNFMFSDVIKNVIKTSKFWLWPSPFHTYNWNIAVTEITKHYINNMANLSTTILIIINMKKTVDKW